MALSVLCISCGAASLPHNHLWVLASLLVCASAFSGEIKAFPGVFGCTELSLISAPCSAGVGMGIIREQEGLGCPSGAEHNFPGCVVGSRALEAVLVFSQPPLSAVHR